MAQFANDPLPFFLYSRGIINLFAGQCGLSGAVALRLCELRGELLGFEQLQLQCLTKSDEGTFTGLFLPACRFACLADQRRLRFCFAPRRCHIVGKRVGPFLFLSKRLLQPGVVLRCCRMEDPLAGIAAIEEWRERRDDEHASSRRRDAASAVDDPVTGSGKRRQDLTAAAPGETDKPGPDINGSPWLCSPLRLRSHAARRGTRRPAVITPLARTCEQSDFADCLHNALCRSSANANALR